MNKVPLSIKNSSSIDVITDRPQSIYSKNSKNRAMIKHKFCNWHITEKKTTLKY